MAASAREAATGAEVHRAVAFGMTWAADIALDGFDSVADRGGPADVRVARVDALADRGPGRTVNRGHVHADGVRIGWDDEVTFDIVVFASPAVVRTDTAIRIAYLPGPGWRGRLPDAFYGTVAALVLAWRGTVPFHACAVALDGQAVLIAGRSGAGKSSLTAGLLGAGLRLVADDLTAVTVTDGGIAVLRGRPTMRQHRDTAARFDADLRARIIGDARGKWLVRPRARVTDAALPLAGVLVLADPPGVPGAADRIALLAAQLFRPRWLAAFPNHVARRRDLLAIAAHAPMQVLPALAAFDPAREAERIAAAHARIAAMVAACRRLPNEPLWVR